jgi:hypothetical protein
MYLIMQFKYKYYSLMPHQAHNPNYFRRAPSILPQAIAPSPHTNLLNVHIQIANERWFQKNVM